MCRSGSRRMARYPHCKRWKCGRRSAPPSRPCTSRKGSSCVRANDCSRWIRAPRRPISARLTAQLTKDRADLANAERNLTRQRELFQQKFISQAALDTAQNAVDGLRGQLAVDQAAVESSRVARSFGEISAPIAGRTGAIAVYPGSLVQPSGAALVSITQIDPINVSFTLPEPKLAALQQALAKGQVSVSATLDAAGQQRKGRLVFVDNAVDTASGTIRLKAEFPNADHRLWPGMFVTCGAGAAHAGRRTHGSGAGGTDRAGKEIYLCDREDPKVSSVPVKVRLIQDGLAVIEGIAPGTRVVVEGAQNLRPGSVVVEADDAGQKAGSQNNAGTIQGCRSKPTAQASNESLRVVYPPSDHDGAAVGCRRAGRHPRLQRHADCRATELRFADHLGQRNTARRQSRRPWLLRWRRQLERQFSTISGLSVISSTSTLGNTSITLEFDQDRNIDSAAIDVQAALLRAQRSLPMEMTSPPSYRKVNPADAPIIFLTLTSPSMPLSDLNSFADNLISPTLSTLARRGAGATSTGRKNMPCACA